jgi:hypothetical protein
MPLKGAVVKNMKTIHLSWAIFGLFLFYCANPVDYPLKWRTKFEIPVTNESFVLGEEMPKLFEFDSTMDFLKAGKTYSPGDIRKLISEIISGDTVEFSVLRSDTSSFENHQDSLDEKLYHAAIGPIPVSGAGKLGVTVPVPAVSGTFSVPVTINIDSVYRIVFYDTSVNILDITLKNPSTSSLSNVSIAIAGLGSDSIGSIPAGATRTAQIDVSGKALYDTAVVTLSGSTNGAAGKSLEIEMSLNGLLASSLTVDDHLIDLSMHFSNAYRLTDTVKIDYIDITEGAFAYTLTNHTNLELRLQMIHENVWIRSHVESKGIISAEDLGRADSSYFWGDLNQNETVVPPRQKTSFKNLDLSAKRIFPEWDNKKKESVTIVNYHVKTGTPRGDTITLSSADSLIFSISARSFKFEDFEGTVMEAFHKQGDTVMIPIELPFGDQTIKDSLRGKFVLKRVNGDVQIQTGMPDEAFIDTMLIDFLWYCPDSIEVADSTRTVFKNVNTDSSFLRSIDITRITNLYPDSIAISTRLYIPVGTRMRVVNDLKVTDPDFNRFIGRMIIRVNTDYRLNARLDWEVLDTVTMNLGSGRFEVPEALDYVGRLEDRLASFNMYVSNNSNLNLYIFALVAPETLIDSLDSMETSRFYSLLFDEGKAEEEGYVNMLGTKGIYIPPRNADSVFNSITLNDKQLETILSSDSCGWRWAVRFVKQDRDAMTDTDFIKINSWLHVEGINNADSLLIW